MPPVASTLLITHTDRDGLLSGAALLRALGDGPAPDRWPGSITILPAWTKGTSSGPS